MSAPQQPPLKIEFPPELPVSERREELEAAIRDHQVVIVAGETGSGKTTQLPKICLQLGRQAIGHTQPRRLAARTVAQRIASELGEDLGESIGYQVRFTEQVSELTRVKLMTDGILLAEIQQDRLLRRYDTLIIDEAHERSLNIDFLLGYLKTLLPRRPDLKVIITSATIDVDAFSAHFHNAPVIEVSGRTYPVQMHYLDPTQSDGDLGERIAETVRSVLARDFGPAGDMLVFLSGEGEIRTVAQHLRRCGLDSIDILPLYARLSQKDQARVFQRGKSIRVVLSTNVAETSLTVPGIRFVIDPGYARISRYSVRSKIQRLPIEAISQASANQRAGRCGRTADGVCLRLYTEEDFQSRPEFTEPEIRRTNLAAVILQMLRLNLGDVAQFPFINPPDSRLVRDGFKLLEELGAVDDTGRLNDVGRQMSRLPVDPRLARMMLAASAHNCLSEMLVICSALTLQDPRERPQDKQQAAAEQHRRFNDERSDFMSLVALWGYCEEQRQALSQNQWRKQCRKEYLNYLRVREWRDTHYQITVAARRIGFKLNPEPANYEAVHRALMSGLLGHMAQWKEGHEYLGARNRSLYIAPGSSLFKKRPRWLMAAEIVETSRVFARCVASVEPEWALEINPGLLKHHYFEPHWQARSGRVMAFQRTTLYGLVLVEKQRVHYGPIQPQEARELMIRGALVEGRCRRPPSFLKRNQALMEEIQELESKVRRRDLLVDEQALFEFYDQRLPAQMTTMGRLVNWLKRKPENERSVLLTRDSVLLRSVQEDLGEQFPDHVQWRDLELPLSYCFDPGDPADGVSVTVPVALLNRIPRWQGEWLVPGLLREKCIRLVKLLPKSVRKNLVPVPDAVDRALVDMVPEDESLTRVLALRFSATAGTRIAPEDWNLDELEDYYRLNYRVVDAQGELLAQGRDLLDLVQRYRTQTRTSLAADTQATPTRSGITRWDFGTLEQHWRSRQAGVDIESYPALVDDGDSVSIQMLDYPGEAAVSHRRGLLKLLRLQLSQDLRYLRKQLLRGNAFNLVLAGSGQQRDVLLEQALDATVSWAMLEPLGDSLVWDEESFRDCLSAGKPKLAGYANTLNDILQAALGSLSAIRSRLAQEPQRYRELEGDINSQIHGLWQQCSLADVPSRWLRQYPRYHKALETRLERYAGQQRKDAEHSARLAALQAPLDEALSRQPLGVQLSPDLLLYRWQLEEFRVSLFAQALGTEMPVSEKRLQQQWQKALDTEVSGPL